MPKPTFTASDGMNVRCFLIFLLVTATIFYLSNVPGLRFAQADMLDQSIRKAGHVFVYALLTFFLWRGLPGLNKNVIAKIILCAVITLGIAGGDEINQYFVEKRAGNLIGFAFNAVGISLALFFLTIKNRIADHD